MVELNPHGTRIGPVAWTAWARTAGLAVCLIGPGACNKAVDDSRSSSLLVIEVLEASPGGSAPQFSGQLQSDVARIDANGNATVFDDIGRVGARLALKDPGSSADPTSPTSANFITVTRYHVDFTRSDGRNTPGVDVPHSFDGGVTFTVVDVIAVEFTLVRGQAKLEAPLLALRGGGGAVSIATIAEVTFFGQDQTGAAVSATGRIGVTFADFADAAG